MGSALESPRERVRGCLIVLQRPQSPASVRGRLQWDFGRPATRVAQMRMYGADAAVPLKWFTLKGEAGYSLRPRKSRTSISCMSFN